MGRRKIAIPQNARFGQAMSRQQHDKEAVLGSGTAVGVTPLPRWRGGDRAAVYSFHYQPFGRLNSLQNS